MKRLAPSLFLVVLAVAAVVYLLVIERGRPSDAERALRAQSVLPVFRPEELTVIALERPGDDLALVKKKEWSMVSPQVATVDTAAVETLIGMLGSASTVRIASASTPGGSLGETRARLELTFVTGGVTTHESLTLRGPASSPAGAAYATRDDGTIVVASADLVTELMAPSDRFRDRVVVPYPLTRIDRLIETVPGVVQPVLELTRSGTGTFRLGDGRRAARSMTDALGVALADLRVETFLSATSNANAKIAEAPSRIVELVPPDGEPRATLRFGGACPGHDEQTTVALEAPAPFVGCVVTSALAALVPADDTRIERHLFQAKVDEVSALLLRTPDGQLDLARKGAGWHERAPTSRDLDPGESDAATALLEQLVAAQGTPHPLAPSPGAAEPRAVTLRVGDPATDEVFAWAPAGAGGESRELTVSPEVRALLEPTARTLKPLPLWNPSLDPAKVAAIDRVSLGCPGREQLLTHRESGWWLGDSPAVMADQAGVIDLIDAVVHARARRWIEHGALAPGQCRGAELSTQRQPMACLGFVGGAADVVAEVQQGADGAPSFAVVDPALEERVCRWYLDRHGFALPPDVSTVTLLRGGRRVMLSAEAAAFATLNDLVADDVVHPGAPRADDHLDPPDLEVEVRGAKGSVTRLRFGAVIGSVRRGIAVGGGAALAVFAFDAARLDPVFGAAGR